MTLTIDWWMTPFAVWAILCVIAMFKLPPERPSMPSNEFWRGWLVHLILFGWGIMATIGWLFMAAAKWLT